MLAVKNDASTLGDGEGTRPRNGGPDQAWS